MPRPADFHEVLRCTRGNETRVYSLLAVPNGAELWRVTESPETGTHSIRESHFHDPEEASRFLDELRRALTAGGWEY
jgi:hypothetical protein